MHSFKQLVLEVHYVFACVFNQLGETPSLFFVELADGFVCLIVSRLKAAQSRRPPTDCPWDTREGSGVHVPPPGETLAKKQSQLRGSRHKPFSNLFMSALPTCVLQKCESASTKPSEVQLPEIVKFRYMPCTEEQLKEVRCSACESVLQLEVPGCLLHH